MSKELPCPPPPLPPPPSPQPGPTPAASPASADRPDPSPAPSLPLESPPSSAAATGAGELSNTQVDAVDASQSSAAGLTSPADADADADAAAAAEPAAHAPKVVLCPYCGQTQTPSHKCNACGGLFEPLSRRATQIAMGPWFLRDKHQPFRPGFSYTVLRQLITAGRISPTTVLRGPTTRQFWSIARNVPGVAHLLGYCHHCGIHVPTDPSPPNCPSCDARFKSVRQRNELGLQFPTRRAAESAQRALNRILGIAPVPADAAGRASDPGSGGSRRSSRDAEGKLRKSRSGSKDKPENPELSEAMSDADQQELAAAAAAARGAGPRLGSAGNGL